MSISIPAQITVPFATSGLKNAIPATSNNVTGNAGYDQGFPAINMTPTTGGGIPPFGQDFNGILFAITEINRFFQAGGSYAYSSSFATAVGGYPIGSIVQRTDNSGLWRNTSANNSTDPEAGGAGWQPEGSGITTVAMTNANVTLTSLQAARNTILITGVITANIQLILPTYQKQWLIVNNGTGAFSVTVKTPAGSGVAVPTSTVALVYGDGTNIAQSISLATNAQMAAGTSTTLIPPVSAVMSLFSKRVFSTNDYIRIPDVPGGLIIQFGTRNFSGVAQTTITWPIPFPNAFIADAFLGGGSNFIGGVSANTTQRIINAAGPYPGTAVVPNTSSFTYIAIGY